MDFIKYLQDNENVLMEKILNYAQTQGYTKYTSTLIEAWRVSIQGLTESIAHAYEENIAIDFVVDVIPDNALTAFGTKEAILHRDRGVTLDMFLTLTKYYRDSYIDLITESEYDTDSKMKYTRLLTKMFDQIEVSFIYEWTKSTTMELENNLQKNTRQAVNEKNKYLTIFESIPTPLIILDENYKLNNLNFAAQDYFSEKKQPGQYYYNHSGIIVERIEHIDFGIFLDFDFDVFASLQKLEDDFEHQLESVHLQGKIMKILDVSRRTVGYLLAFNTL